MKITNKYGLPKQFLKAVTDDTYDGPSVMDDGILSVTSLLNPPHQRLLKRKFNDFLEVDVTDRIWVLFGSAVHMIMESGADANDIVEERYEEVIELLVLGKKVSMRISGAIDYYNKLRKTIQDFKTASAYTLKNDRILEGYMWQLNFYAYMLRKKGYEVVGLEDIFIIKDYSKTRKNAPSSVVTLPVEVKSDVEIEDKIKELIVHQLTYEGVCTPEERWHTPDQKAVMKEGRKSAVKVFKDNPSDDIVMDFIMEQKGDLSKYYIEARPGKDGRCENYCDCNKFCSHYKGEAYEGREYLEKKLTKDEIKNLEK